MNTADRDRHDDASQQVPVAARQQDGAAGAAQSDKDDSKRGWSFLFEVLVTVCAVIGAAVMWKQLDLMQESNRITREALDYTKRSAEEGDAATRKALELADRSARAAENAAEAAQQQGAISKRGLGITARSISNRERPWVFVTAMSGKPNLDPPTRSTVTIQVKNLGTLPAMAAVIYATSRILPMWFSQGPTPPPPGPHHSVSLIGPDAAVTSELVLTKDALERQDPARVLKGAAKLYVYGWVWYADPLGRKHTLRFCEYFLLDGGDHPWAHCPHHNDTD